MTQATRKKLPRWVKAFGGLAITVVALFAALLFRHELVVAVRWTANTFGDWITDWVPNHQGQAAVVAGFGIVALFINWIASRKGRLFEWLFAIVVEIGIWVLFWYAPFVPSLNELLGLDVDQMDIKTMIISGGVVIAVTGVVFWFMELREEWRKIRRKG